MQLPHFFESKFTHAMHLELVLNPKLRIKANSFSQLAGTERIEMPGKRIGVAETNPHRGYEKFVFAQ